MGGLHDDWGLEGFRGKQITDLLGVIEDRYERRSTVIISQLPVNQWYDLMDNPTVADALLDRLIHNAHRLELQGESQRTKHWRKSTKSSKKKTRRGKNYPGRMIPERPAGQAEMHS